MIQEGEVKANTVYNHLGNIEVLIKLAALHRQPSIIYTAFGTHGQLIDLISALQDNLGFEISDIYSGYGDYNKYWFKISW